MTRKRRIFISVFALTTLAITVTILLYSSRTGSESVRDSDRIIPLLSSLGVNASRYTLSYIVRKSAHFLEYFALCASASGFTLCITKNKKALIIPPLYCLAVALCDEFLVQAATIGRSPELKDVFIDLFGALTAVSIIALAVYRTSKRSKK
ncbi:MAG: VanZ family protein [Clostridia bacterium]|nr:VanZ family protein [Clostridia bacterium]